MYHKQLLLNAQRHSRVREVTHTNNLLEQVSSNTESIFLVQMHILVSINVYRVGISTDSEAHDSIRQDCLIFIRLH